MRTPGAVARGEAGIIPRRDVGGQAKPGMLRQNVASPARKTRMSRPVFFVSDGTGITAETIGHSLLTQFSGIDFRTLRISFVDSEAKAEAAATEIRNAGEHAGFRPIVVNSVVKPELSAILAGSGALML